MEKTMKSLPNGETIAFYDMHQDQKETLVLLHGNMSGAIHYKPLMDALNGQYRLIVPDLRGFGDSTYHTDIASLKDFAEDIMMLLDALSLDGVHVAGWSTGAGVAMRMAAHYQARVKSLILIEPAPHQGFPIYAKDENLQPIMDKPYLSKQAMAEDPVQVAPIAQALEKNNEAFMQMLWDQAIFNVTTPRDADKARYIEATMKQRNLVDVDWALVTHNMGHNHNGVVDGDGSIDLITCHALAFYGEKDLVIPKVWFDATVDALNNVKVVIMPEASHAPIVDEPEMMASSIINFIDAL